MTIKIPIFGEVNLLKLFYELLFNISIFFIPIIVYLNHLNRNIFWIIILTIFWTGLMIWRDNKIVHKNPPDILPNLKEE